MVEPSPTSPTNTFIVRFWREWSLGQVRWRSRIEHVQSGEHISCLDLEGILDFIEHWGVMTEQSGEHGEENV